MFSRMAENLKKQNKKIVFTEGTDKRILEAASRLLKENILTPILVGNSDDIKKAADEYGYSLNDMELIDPSSYADFDKMVAQMVEIRKGKMTVDECKNALKKSNYFGTMLVKMGIADCLLGGATYSTADTVRPALQIIKTRPGSKVVSSCFIMNREINGEKELLAMGDCAINLEPNADEIVEIALETARTAKIFSIEPKVALLSYSSLGSGKGDSVAKMQDAAAKLKGMELDFAVDGELQFDAAYSDTVAKTKAPNSPVAGKANTFIFPDINSGNIGYKIAQRLGGFEAYGPILQGLNAPINDLSRGCNADEIYTMAIITASLI
ncbi:MAG: phosphate acetyltransferase [Clostridiales bacterium]|nr:phosphate acetyltransferase [Clostridiales bacterium]